MGFVQLKDRVRAWIQGPADIRRTLNVTQLATFSVHLPNPAQQGMPTPTGTGFFVSPEGWFVTAAHVVTENGQPDGKIRSDIPQAWLMKETRPGKFISGMCEAVVVEYVSPETDFALLKVDFEANKSKDFLSGKVGFPYVTVSGRELEEGEPVYSFGYPLSSSAVMRTTDATFGSFAHCPRVTSAIVSSTMEKTRLVSSPGDTKVYVLDKALNYGNSGGPIVAVGTGHVHAVCSSFQPVTIPQPHIRDEKGNPLRVWIPSLYGIVSSLSNAVVQQALRSRGIDISSR